QLSSWVSSRSPSKSSKGLGHGPQLKFRSSGIFSNPNPSQLRICSVASSLLIIVTTNIAPPISPSTPLSNGALISSQSGAVSSSEPESSPISNTLANRRPRLELHSN